MKALKIRQGRQSDQPIPILKEQLEDGVKLMICITHFNEEFSQLVESLVGVYRNYYELCQRDKLFKGDVSVVIISDGFDTFDSVVTKKKVNTVQNKADSSPEEFRLADQLTRAGIYDETKIAKKFLTIQKNGAKVLKDPVSLDFMSKITNIKQENGDIDEEKDKEFEKVLNMHFETENLLH